jgi:Protein kinase domain
MAMANLQPGAVVGGYTIEEQIGRGGMGVVYRATDLRLGRPVALKLVSGESAGDVRFRSRFLRESRAAASIDHPHILPIYEADEAGGELYIAMRLVDGEDLRDLLRREGGLEMRRAVRLTGQVAQALDAVHAVGLVHRDVKPGNILLASPGPREHAYLTDFGITKLLDAETLTTTDAFVGTADYCAPEVIRGEQVDGRADVYSLGCVLFECLTGARPFARESTVASLYAHLEEEPPTVRELRPELPEALGAVVARALAKSPADRFQTAGELAEAADAAVGERMPEAAPPPRRRGPRGRRALLALGGVAAGAAVAVLAVIVLSGGSGGGGASTSATSASFTPLTPVKGVTRIGSDLSQGPGGSGYCTDRPGEPCTDLQVTLGTVDQAVPKDGVITSWSVRNGKGTLALRVIAGPAGARHVVANGPTVHASGTGGLDTWTVRIPVRAGQRIGVELGDDGYLPIRYRNTETRGEFYDPPLGAVPVRPSPDAELASTYELLYAAMVEPDRDHDGLGDVTQDRNPSQPARASR